MSLVLWYPFYEGTGIEVADLSGNGNPGYFRPIGGEPGWIAGIYKWAVNLNGLNQLIHIGVPSVLLFGTGSFSLTAWIYINLDSMPSAWKGIVNKGASGGVGYAMSVSSGNSLSADIQGLNGANQHINGGASILTTRKWYHCGAVFDRKVGGYGYVYLNGKQAVSGSLVAGNDTGSVDGIAQVSIGSHAETSWFFPGYIDEVRLFSYALSPSEMLREAGMNYYSMIMGTGTTKIGL